MRQPLPRRRPRMALVSLTLIWLTASAVRGAEPPADSLWWEQEKIRFFWGHAHLFDEAGVSNDQLMASLAKVGATVFVSHTSAAPHPDPIGKQLRDAKTARQHGVRSVSYTHLTLPTSDLV